MRTTRIRTIALLIALSAAGASGWVAPGAALGDILYGVTLNGNRLVRFDTDTLVGSEVGSTGFDDVGGLAFGHTGVGGDDPVLYGLVASGDALITLNTETGAGTLVGALGKSVTFSTGLAHDPVTRTLYGVSNEGSGMSSLLMTISKTTGAAAVVGDTYAGAIVGMGFDATGQLWGIDGGARAKSWSGSTRRQRPGTSSPSRASRRILTLAALRSAPAARSGRLTRDPVRICSCRSTQQPDWRAR